MSEQELGLIGRDYTLIRKLAGQLHQQIGRAVRGNRVTDLWENIDRSGFSFEVEVADGDGKPTGHVASVRVTLARIEVPPVPPVKRKVRPF